MRNLINSNQSVTGLVEKYIGSAYDKVQLVADNMHTIENIVALFRDKAGSVSAIEQLIPHLGALDVLLQNIDAVLALKGVSHAVNHTYAELHAAGAANNVNGTECVIDLTKAPYNLKSYYGIALFIDGVYQGEGKSYTLNGFTVTLSEILNLDDVVSIVITDKLTDSHFKGGSGVQKEELRLVAPHSLTVVSNLTVVNLSANNFRYEDGKNQLMVFVDGKYMKSGTDYQESSSTSISLVGKVADGSVIDIIKFY